MINLMKTRWVKISSLLKLGEGASGIVRKAMHKKSGEFFAIKTVNRKNLNKDEDAALKEEISILRMLRHDHIIGFINSFATMNFYHLVTEYLEGGELLERIASKTTYTESEARDVCRVLFNAVSYIHSQGIAHRDLKVSLYFTSKHNSL